MFVNITRRASRSTESQAMLHSHGVRMAGGACRPYAPFASTEWASQ